MAKRNYATRIAKLKERRNGQGEGIAFDSLSAGILREAYQERAPHSDSLQYALGAMQEVASKYTAVSHQEKERVSRQLIDGLARKGQEIEIELQGSLAVNIHLRRYSDVDLLILPTDFFIYDRTGPLSLTSVSYTHLTLPTKA